MTPGPWEVAEIFVNNEPNRLIVRRPLWGARTIADCGAVGEVGGAEDARAIAALPDMRDALAVIALTPTISAFLLANDPKALTQVQDALDKAGWKP